MYFFFFFFNDTATTEIYTLSLHDALPISSSATAQIRSSAPSERPANSRTKRSGLRRSIPAGGGAGRVPPTRGAREPPGRGREGRGGEERGDPGGRSAFRIK